MIEPMSEARLKEIASELNRRQKGQPGTLYAKSANELLAEVRRLREELLLRDYGVTCRSYDDGWRVERNGFLCNDGTFRPYLTGHQIFATYAEARSAALAWIGRQEEGS